MTTEEYFSTSEEETYNIFSNIIDKKDNDIILIRISFYELLQQTVSWCFNRELNKEKSDEIYNSLKISYDIPFIMHAVYDDKRGSDRKKLLILDGQHRIEAISTYLQNDDHLGECEHNVWIWIYKIDYSETTNKNKVVDIFKKINNNRVFSETELPNLFIIDLINALCEVSVFKKNKVIGDNDKRNTCHSPCIHKKELNYLFNIHRSYIMSDNNNIQDIIKNIQKINHRISIKPYEELFRIKNTLNLDKWNKAVNKGFFLNLKDSCYPPDVWIKFINDPDKI